MPNGSHGSTETWNDQARRWARYVAIGCFALAGVRASAAAGGSLFYGALWGVVVGSVFAYGERRSDPHRPDRSGVLGSVVDTPPESAIVRMYDSHSSRSTPTQ